MLWVPSRVIFSGEHFEFDEIALQYKHFTIALEHYFLNVDNFLLYAQNEIDDLKQSSLLELNRKFVLTLLAAIEARIRIDYLSRKYNKDKSGLSKEFRYLYDNKGERASLEGDIFKIWKSQGRDIKKVFDELGSCFKYRHWLAHGRYWVLGSAGNNDLRFDFDEVYILATFIKEIVNYEPK